MDRTLSSPLRRLVLGGAFLAATTLAFLPDATEVRAAQADAAGPLRLAQADAKAPAGAASDTTREAAREAARDAAAAAREAAAAARDAAREANRSARRGRIDIDLAEGEGDSRDKGDRTKHSVRINLDGMDREYDSFDQFVGKDPALATMVIGIVFIVFLTPILFTALVIWYKVRRTRMVNETMLKMAEKGYVPSAEAMEALHAGQAGPAAAALPAGAPLLEQARSLRQRAAWSDLRKGVLMGATGLAITLFSLADDGSPNWIGLVLLFVGIGFAALWYFETRNAPNGNTVRLPGSGDGPN
jgi:Domain of unknown function (DUF6249)